MINPDKNFSHLARHFIRIARQADHSGHVTGTTLDKIVAALINGRADWLPSSHRDPLDAVKRLHASGWEFWATMLYVHGLDWRD